MMQYLSIDYLIIYAFLATILIIGLRAGKNLKDIREYAIANKMYGTLTLTLTFLATNIGSGTVIDGAAGAFSEGIIKIIPGLGVIISLLFIAFFIAKKIVQFDDCLTLGDVMKQLYGETSKLIAGILGLCYSIAMVSMGLLGLGIVAETILNIPATWGIILGGMILTLYSGQGGMKSVSLTDVFQFLILIIVFPLIAHITLKNAGGLQAVFTSLPSVKFQIFEHKNFTYYLTLFLVWSVFPVGITSPPIFQRLLMAREAKQIRNQYLIVAGFHPTFQLLIMLIGLAGFVLYPTIVPKNLVPHIIQQLLPVGAKGLAIAGLLAVIMSTADSYLHSASLLLAHDILKPMCDRAHIKLNELRVAQYGTLVIIIVAIMIALKSTNILGLSFAAVRFTGPLLMFPLIAGIMGLKTDRLTFYIASGLTLIAFIASTWLLPAAYSHLGVVISILANIISFLTIHIIKNSGFAIVDRSKGTEVVWQPRRKSLLVRLKQILPTPEHIIQYSQKRIAHYGAPYMLFGIFFVINYTLPFFMWTHSSPHIYDLMFTLRIIGGLLCGLLIVQDQCPKWLMPYMPTYWHLTVLYCLPFMNTLMFLLTEGSIEWTINIAITIILLLIVVDWVTALTLGGLGFILGLVFYKWLVGNIYDIHFNLDFTAHYLMIYQLTFGLLIGLIFARRKQLSFDKVAVQRDYIKGRQQENYIRLAEVLKYREEFLKDLTSHETPIFNDVTIAYIKQAVYRMTDYLRLEVAKCEIDELLKEILAILKLQDFDEQPQIIPKKYTKQENIHADIAKIKQLIINGFNYIHTNNPENKPITIALEDAMLGHKIAHIKNYTRKLSALKITITTEKELPPIQDIYIIDPTKSSTWTPESESELPLLENACIIDAHYGHAELRNHHTHAYVIPVHIREVRGKVMELLREPAAADPEELKHPLAIELEQELFIKLKNTQVNLIKIQKALDLIKKYHGGVRRKSGEPFFTHPITVALILLDYSQDEEAVITALLHDTVEDTNLSMAYIRALFGDTVAFLLGKVTNLEDSIRRIHLADHENLHRLIYYEDKRAALVKLADRLHNMRTIEGHPSIFKQKNIANETLAFFVPMAKHLELPIMAQELEELSLEVLNKKE